MTSDREAGDDTGDDRPRRRVEGSWPVPLRGVTESVVTTLGPNERWNVAALGLHAPDLEDGDAADDRTGSVTATTWGRTRTWRNFRERGEGYVQFTADPRDFVDAAVTVREEAEPVLASADAWVRVTVDRREEGTEDGTQWVRWALEPREGAVRRERPATINRGFCAVVDATVAASRLDVDAYETDVLLDRLAYFADVVDACGGPRERAAFARIDEATGWRERREDTDL